MHVIVGLGNPDTRYAKTRHNAGFMVVDRLADRHAPGAVVRARFHAGTVEGRIGDQRCMLMKPSTYMNRSGQSVGEAVRFFKADATRELVVITDDVALPPGHIRVRAQGGTGGHNGLADIERALGTKSYARVRVGVGAKPPYMDQADWVLSRFDDDEWRAVEPALEKAADAVECVVTEGVTSAMNKFNEKQVKTDEQPPDDLDPGWLGGSH